MGRLKTFRKYIIWIVAFYLFTVICTYIGFNATYNNIDYIEKPIDQINVEIAQSTTVNRKNLWTNNKHRRELYKRQIYKSRDF